MNKALQEFRAKQDGPVTWEKVISVVSDEKTRPVFWSKMAALQNKRSGETVTVGNAEVEIQNCPPTDVQLSFLKSRAMREVVCDALSYTEDWMEGAPRHKQWNELRERVACVRRSLENELWS